MTLQLPSEHNWAAACAQDGEFCQVARHWTGTLTLQIGTQNLSINLTDGAVSGGAGEAPLLSFSGSEEVWQQVLQQVPKRFHNDLTANISTRQGLSRQGDAVVHAQYYAAIMRAVELLRPVNEDYPLRPGDISAHGHVDTPTGHYIHLQLGGQDHRLYYEQAGQGIPLLLQHTAGCHGSQWRHLFEMPEITQRFRLIAYDLPCHGKSLPPLEQSWWAQPYQLQGEFLRSVPVQLAQALQLDNPVFLGCSVGGLLALDLAHKHADLFRAVIAVEGALAIEGQVSDVGELWHPQVNNEYKARLMDGLMSPSSPEAYRKETSFVYACGWPPAFIGDLHYYLDEFDLTQQAGQIDTAQVAVHILSGEYDYSGTSELGFAAHQAIAGSSWTQMSGVGHFPMSENPMAFAGYLQPILDSIK